MFIDLVVCVQVCRGHQRTLSRSRFSLLPCGFRRLNSVHEAFAQKSAVFNVHTFLPFSLDIGVVFINLKVDIGLPFL